MTPEQAIGMLDRQIQRHGEPVSFRRGTMERDAHGFVRGYKPEQLVGLIAQKDRQVIVSPTTLGAFAPKANDDFVGGGELGKVIAAEAVRMGGTIIRWNIQVRMA